MKLKRVATCASSKAALFLIVTPADHSKSLRLLLSSTAHNVLLDTKMLLTSTTPTASRLHLIQLDVGKSFPAARIVRSDKAIQS